MQLFISNIGKKFCIILAYEKNILDISYTEEPDLEQEYYSLQKIEGIKTIVLPSKLIIIKKSEEPLFQIAKIAFEIYNA